MKTQASYKNSQLSKGNWLIFLDVIKGIAIILVVYGHVIEHSMAPWSGQAFFLNPVFKIIYTFHMPLFVFISGYLMAYSLQRRSEQEVFKSRVKSLLVPFVVLSILGILVTYLINSILTHGQGRIDVAGDIANQLFLKPAVWFLFTLFVLSALLIFSVKLEKKFGSIVFVIVYFLLMCIPYNDYCALFYIKWFYLFYLAGYFFNKSNIKISNAIVRTTVFIIALIVFILMLPHWHTDDYIYVNKMDFVPYHYLHMLSKLGLRYMIGFLGIGIAFYAGSYLSRTKIASALGKIGAYSLDIYIIQMFILEGLYPRLIYKANVQLDFNSPWVLYIVAPLIAIFFLGICMFISKFLIRKNSLLNKLLLGGRVSRT